MQTTARHISRSLLAILSLGAFGCSHHTGAAATDSPADGGADQGGANGAMAIGVELQNPLPTSSDPTAGNGARIDGSGGAPAGLGAVSPAARTGAGGEGGEAGEDGEAGSSDASAAADARRDIAPPHVVAVSPARGALGVDANARISIVFSEPMNRRATNKAFASDSLPRGEARMSWNKAGTVLTITPSAPLVYAHANLTGAEVLELDAKAYGYTLTSEATDLAGNALPETSVQFSTLREVTHTVKAVPALTGVVAGSVADDAPYYGFITLNLGELPEGIVALRSVIARANPYVAPASIPVYDAEFVTLDAAATHAGPGTLVTTLPSGLRGDQWVPESIWPFLAEDYRNQTANYHYSQVRLALPAGTDAASAQAASSLLQSFSLEADYLLP